MKKSEATSKAASSHEEQHTGRGARTIMYGMLLAFAIITLLAACGMAGDDTSTSHLHGSETWEKTASEADLPAFLDNHTRLTSDLYAEVHAHAHLLSEIPCYCGCMAGTEIDEPHDSLLRCYWAELPDADGSIMWTDHSTGCGICKKELEEVIALSKQGKTLEQIVAYINENYKPNLPSS
ncbi:PCYCGC motif-containing (lipo)protein [Paenibacillus sp. PL2-23]|uniref:PCYCGC motif-containing (lipo)protein n=1 Tax=Paenibacillus sp. PL2-23 TaxID=2100729 RepID=UPI0030F54FD9